MRYRAVLRRWAFRPDLEKRLADAGISLVMLYTLSGRQDDLTPMADLGEMGFWPSCTALVLNHIHFKKVESHQSVFRLTTRHPAYKAAIDHGAVPIWLPHLSSAALVRDRHITFGHAMAGTMPAGNPAKPLGIAQSDDVAKWWRAVADALAPIEKWMP